MTLIKSISGIRGTIGGAVGAGLTPIDIVKYVSGFGTWVQSQNGKKIVIGRDARISGELCLGLVSDTLRLLGVDVIDLGLSTTPTVEVAVMIEKADGGIIITASHNPINWNALKLLNNRGEILSAEEGLKVEKFSDDGIFSFANVYQLGGYISKPNFVDVHIDLILKHPLVDRVAISKANLKVVVDAVNSTGGIAVPLLLEKLGVVKITKLNCEPTGNFAHNPEPLPEHLSEISDCVKNGYYDLGIAVDPDVDRLALIQEDGVPFGEEYTLVSVADYVLQNMKGATVSNLSSTQALRDITENANCQYFVSEVGEVNVVKMMKDCNAVIGGEGNGGVIVADFHYGRDALIGIALFLTLLSKSKKKVSDIRKEYPSYCISKNKLEIDQSVNIENIIEKISHKFRNEKLNKIDGLRIDFINKREWVQLRKSNTEPIIRVYAEAESMERADQLAMQLIEYIKLIK